MPRSRARCAAPRRPAPPDGGGPSRRRLILRGILGLFGGLVGQAWAADAVPRPWPAGTVTPPLDLEGADGAAWRLADARGRPVLLHFWASWCEPCIEELPTLVDLARRHATEGLLVVTVNHREGDPALQRFLSAHPLPLPILRDRDGAAARRWGVRLFPSTIGLDRRGRARFTVAGAADWSGEPARGWIAPLLAT